MLILASIISVSTSSFASLGCVPVSISSSAVGIKIFVTTLGIKKYKWIIRKEKKKHDNIVLPGKDTLDIIKVRLSKVLIDSYISQEEFVSNSIMRWKTKKIWNICDINSINMVDISKKTHERNGIEIIVDHDRILWLNEKHMEEGLSHKGLREITAKYH